MSRKKTINLLIICLFLTTASPAISPDSTGSFDMDLDNDPPSFIDWLDQTALVNPLVNVEFYATVYDIDNSTTQLDVTLWYSNDTFASDNNTYIMNYIGNPVSNQYYFTYTFPGQAVGVYYQYYYQAYDGNTTVTEDNGGLYYDIQWLAVSVGGAPEEVQGIPPAGSSPDVVINPDLIILAALIVAMILGVIGILAYKEQLETKYHHIKYKNKYLDKRIFLGLALIMVISVTMTTSFSTYTTFEYDGATLEWKVEECGIISTDDIVTVLDSVNYHQFTRIFLDEIADHDPIDLRDVKKTDVLSDIALSLDEDIHYEDMLDNEALWIRTVFRSPNIEIRKATIYNRLGTLIYEYKHAPLKKDSYEIFIYKRDLQPFIIGDGIFLRYYGTYEHENTIINAFLNVYIDIPLIR